MLQFQVIGNLGADAQVKEINGRKFVTFDVAHSDSWTDEAGTVHSEMIWVSCIMQGDGGKLLSFLTKGRKVYVTGDGSIRVYSSKVQRKMMAGANLNVKQLEVIGGAADEVPRRLVTPDGRVVDVYKAFYIDLNTAQGLVPEGVEFGALTSERGEKFVVRREGWVQKIVEDGAPAETAENQ